MRCFRRRSVDSRRLSTPIAMAELEVLADEALRTALAIKENVALLRAQDKVIQVPNTTTLDGGKR